MSLPRCLLHVGAGPDDSVPLEQAFGNRDVSHERWMSHPVNDDDFLEALQALRDQDEPGHQLGGWADSIQGPVEDEVAQGVLGGEHVELDSPAHAAEAARWTLLWQVGSEDVTSWGDLGTLYWMAVGSSFRTWMRCRSPGSAVSPGSRTNAMCVTMER